MERIERILRKKLKVGSKAVIYVTTCSDIDANLKNARRLLECRVMGIIRSYNKDEIDDRYLIRCSENLREEQVRGGMLPDEALVSVNSPLLLTQEDYEDYMADPAKLSRWISAVTHVIMGCDSPHRLNNWQKELAKILDELNIDVGTAINDIVEDFNPKGGLELIKF